ncbi:MAG: hypothetical protein WCS37_15310 [Chloroflexota bacterium]|nr:hypothetical protein [Chloroflexota bacterium]
MEPQTGDLLGVGTSDGTIRLWNVGNGTEVATLKMNNRKTLPYFLSWSPDGKWLTCNGENSPLWKIRN